ncbi:MAG: hypothetical protein HKN47_18550 [Pirellulaceae bacterium]|nr:hypothetical protein [Pirellulaceae bacterium]
MLTIRDPKLDTRSDNSLVVHKPNADKGLPKSRGYTLGHCGKHVRNSFFSYFDTFNNKQGNPGKIDPVVWEAWVVSEDGCVVLDDAM